MPVSPRFTPILCGLILSAVGSTPMAAAGAPAWTESPIPAAVSILPLAGRWIAASEDNICGLSDLRQLSNPALVDFGRLMRATPEMKQIEDEGIDPNSPRGIQLHQKAVDRVTRGCTKIRKKRSHCSVWKAIRHEDGRRVADITEQVLKVQ